MDNTSFAVIMRRVTKRLGGKQVLKGIDLEVRPGVIHVIAGPNGSGKTTTIRVMLGLIGRDSGVIRVLGVEPGSRGWDRVKTRIGYLPEDAGVYDRLTGWENLLYYALLYTGGDRRSAEELAHRGVELAGLSWDDLNRRAGEYSRGMKRRLLLARTLMHEPSLVVLDEPTSGLDVFSALKIRRTIREMAKLGSTVIVTTHNLLEAQQIADVVSFISDGTVLCTCTPGEALDIFEANDLEEAFVKAVGGRRER